MKLWKLFKIPKIGSVIRKRIVAREGGEKASSSLRLWLQDKANIEVGLYTYGGCFKPEFNVGGKKVTIGRYCSFGQNIRYFGANHPIDDAVLTPYFYNKGFSGFDVKDVHRESLKVGNDVWIGYNTLITSKCHLIGNGAVIGAGSIVTHDVPPYAIVAGSPAKVIRYRFDEQTIKLLEESKWWEYTPEQLMKYYCFIHNPSEWAIQIISNKR